MSYRDLITGTAPTVTGTIVETAHPPEIIYPAGPVYRKRTQVNGTASGATLTTTTSLIPGTASGDASTAGATLSSAESLIAGAASGAASASGALLATAESLVAGTASGAAQASGLTQTVTTSLTSGTASGGAQAAGALLGAPVGLLGGSASGGASTSGAVLASPVTLLAGTASAGGSVTAGGVTFVVPISFLPGTASGEVVSGDATAPGATLPVACTFIPGVATGDVVTPPVTESPPGAGSGRLQRVERIRRSRRELEELEYEVWLERRQRRLTKKPAAREAFPPTARPSAESADFVHFAAERAEMLAALIRATELELRRAAIEARLREVEQLRYELARIEVLEAELAAQMAAAQAEEDQVIPLFLLAA